MERERTQEALAYLQKSAPAYHGQARVLVDEQKFDEAIQKIEFALQLSPENVDYHLFRAHTLEAMQRLPEAIEAYRRVLALRPNDASAKMNLALCEQLVRENGGPLPLTPTRQAQLLDAIVSQKRSADSVLIARALGREAEVAIARIRTRLKSVMAQEKWNDSRIQNSPDGTCALNLSDLSVPDLSILRDLPIAALQIANCGARDLAPLATLRLRELNIDGLQIRDLSPLKGMALQKLSMRDTPVDTLQPVAGMPLRELTITRTLVTELAPLRGMQLRSFAADGVPVRNLAVVQGMPIETLSLRGCGLDVIGAVAWMPLRTLNLADNPISDLSPLSGCSKLRSLILSNTNVRDLRPINALKLDELHLSGTQVVDLLPLRAMPLRQLTVDHAPLADASQLLACTSLEDLAISPGAPNVSALRRLPRLTYISEEWSERDKRAAQRTTDFWRQFDASAPDRETEAKFTSALAGIRLLAGWRESRIEKKADGTYRLDLHKLPINDLSALRGLPISDLDISSTGATQLGPLAKCPLRVLVCYMTSVQDLAPLSGMALEKFDGGDTKINDVRPLRKMPMRWLSLRTTQVSDISPLEGMPLQVVNLGDLKGVTDLKWIQNAALKELDADHTGISDLNAIAGCTLLEKLNCSFTGVSDLRPLVGKKLSILYAAGIKIRNIDVLRGMPLRTLHIDYTEVADLGPLAECKSLEELLIPTTARDVASLRPLSNLRRVSYRRGSNGHAPAQTPAEFWAELDSKTPPGTSPQVAAGISPAWGDSYQYDTGISPAVATNAGRQGPDSSSGRGSIRLALAVHQTEAGAGPLIYRLGRFNGLRVEWGEALRIQPLGARPAISFAGDDVLLVYQAAAGVSPLFYRLGQVTSSRARPTHIAWGDQIRFDAGGAHPSVAMWRNTAVCVQQAREGVGPLTYRVGRIAGARIDWGESVQYETNAIQPAVAIAGNRVVAVHQSEAGVGPLWLRTGQITGTRIQWSEPSTYESAGLRPAVGLNGNDLVAVQQLGTLVSPVSCRVARFNGDRLAWDNPLHIEMTAAEPAVAMGDETIIVVQQAEPAGVGPLWYRLASYRGTSAGVPTP
jgi:Leucine-rich repeat (LRR) protein